jgi:proline iminopeptidase
MAHPAAQRVELSASGGALAGWVQGDGDEVLLLHGGPGLSFDYLDGLAADIGLGYRVATYQQRGIPPSTVEGPHAIAQHVADARAVLDALGWERAWVVGHSWGGHLLLHLAVSAPERLHGGLAIDPLGGVGDGGSARFEQEMHARTPEDDWQRAEELDARAMRGEGTEAELMESMRLVWPAYFAARDDVMPLGPMRASATAYSEGLGSAVAELPALEAALASIEVPLGFVAGAASPLPSDEAAGATARAIPGAWLEVIDGAGHFPWYERPGRVRAALDRLVHGTAQPPAQASAADGASAR